MVPLVLLVRSVVVRRSPGAVRLLFSTLLGRAMQAVLVRCNNCAKLDIVRLSTEVRTTRC
jgi:hypothetical protein